jgi:hypothetical protein
MSNQLHLIKLAVGVDTVDELKAYQVKRYQKFRNREKVFVHITRNMPKRCEELLAGGSLYWVIKGYIRAHQQILDIQKIVIDDIPHCGIFLAKKIINTIHQPQRPFQGWRYFSADKAPLAIGDKDDINNMPEAMREELAALGLL